MMDVLLANVALWSGRTRECVERGNEAIELFQDIGDRWGEVMSTASGGARLRRARQRRGVRDHARALLRGRAHDARRGHARRSRVLVEASVQLQRGNAAEATRRPRGDRDSPTTTTSAPPTPHAAIGLARLQLGDVDGAIAALEGAVRARDRRRPHARRSAAGSRSRTRSRTAATTPRRDRRDERARAAGRTPTA